MRIPRRAVYIVAWDSNGNVISHETLPDGAKRRNRTARAFKREALSLVSARPDVAKTSILVGFENQQGNPLPTRYRITPRPKTASYTILY